MLLENVSWNLSSKGNLFRSRDCLIVSIPKSGRTWLRLFLHKYYATVFNSNETLNSKDLFRDGRPAYYFTHDLYEHQTISNLWQRLTGRFIIPLDQRQQKILLLARDPRDVMVSLYFQNTRREKTSRRYQGSISDMIVDPLRGVDRVIHVMNMWMAEWGNQKNRFLLTRYEDWQANTRQGFSEILRYLEGSEPDFAALEKAIDESSFDRMQARERETTEGPRAFKPGDSTDPESYKARRGKVGGYRDYLNINDIKQIETAMTKLDPRFGYQS